jgi:phage gpG-like protein
MIRFTFDTLSAKLYLGALPKKIHENLFVRMDQAINIFCADVQDVISNKILHRRSGDLASQLARKYVDQTEHTTTGQIGSNLPYARIHEYGGIIRAKNAPYLCFPIGGSALTPGGKRSYAKGAKGEWVRIKQVTIPARHYLSIPWNRDRAKMLETLAQAFRDSVNG